MHDEDRYASELPESIFWSLETLRGWNKSFDPPSMMEGAGWSVSIVSADDEAPKKFSVVIGIPSWLYARLQAWVNEQDLPGDSAFTRTFAYEDLRDQTFYKKHLELANHVTKYLEHRGYCVELGRVDSYRGQRRLFATAISS